MGALSEFVRGRFGVDTRFNATAMATSVGATATQLWRNNPDRLELMFVNLGANTIYLFVDGTVSSTRGIFLAAGGGSVVVTAEDDGELVGFPWFGIASGATAIFSAEVEAV